MEIIVWKDRSLVPSTSSALPRRVRNNRRDLLKQLKAYDELFMHYSNYIEDDNMHVMSNMLGHLMGKILKKTIVHTTIIL